MVPDGTRTANPFSGFKSFEHKIRPLGGRCRNPKSTALYHACSRAERTPTIAIHTKAIARVRRSPRTSLSTWTNNKRYRPQSVARSVLYIYIYTIYIDDRTAITLYGRFARTRFRSGGTSRKISAGRSGGSDAQANGKAGDRLFVYLRVVGNCCARQ